MENTNQMAVRPAGFWVRFIALIIDSIIISAPFGRSAS